MGDLKLIKNVNVFDGRREQINYDASIVIEDDLVKEIVNGEVSEEKFVEVIDGKGKVAIPGLTDAHVHLSHNIVGGEGHPRIDEMAVRSVRVARDTLLRGFTTVRDAGGIVYGLKKNIDNGFLDGPRIFPSNAYISQTSGHGDMRKSRAEQRLGTGQYTSAWLNDQQSIIADGVPEVLRAVREMMFLGASQIKIMAGGGCSSQYDPIQTVQFTFEEMKAAVDAASDYGTYVMAHLYTPASIQRAVKAGVKSLEHTNMMDDETGKIVADSGAWVMPGPQFSRDFQEPDVSGFTKEQLRDFNRARAKGQLVKSHEHEATEAINKYNIPILFGTDSFGDPVRVEKTELDDFRIFKERFGNWKTLRAATGNINELIKLTTYQNPYPEGKIGVLEKGSFADILLVDGNPVEDVEILTDKNNIRLIAKGGVIYKNTL
ncbi:amidohydrolase family protein [Butyrivibrio sp. JL13D10]|uniref:metal-dependent hydrolase family protein n=1 Tax=Butyrivibrio sp. JL13D10 TaxID=3236815 RepID=UPI0038B5EF8B